MDDEYIRKQDAVDALAEYIMNVDKVYSTGKLTQDDCIDCAESVLDGLSSADVVQVRHGKWGKMGVWGRVYRCNQCGNFLDFDGVNAGRGDTNFCPNCGADMRKRKPNDRYARKGTAAMMEGYMGNIDETIITDACLPKSWTCPHCGERNKMGKYKEEEFLKFFRTMQHCDKCGYVHTWKLVLTDDFKKKMISMLVKAWFF